MLPVGCFWAGLRGRLEDLRDLCLCRIRKRLVGVYEVLGGKKEVGVYEALGGRKAAVL